VGVSEKTIYRMLNAEQIPSALKIGGQWRININAVESWLLPSLSDTTGVVAVNNTISILSALNNGTVLYRIHGENRDEALDELLSSLLQVGGLDIKTIKLAILAQESLVSSSLNGIACMRPGREAPFFVDRSIMVIAYLEKPTDFKALDGRKADIILLTLPANLAEEAILDLRLRRMLMDPSFVSRIKCEMPRKDLLLLISETENELMGMMDKKRTLQKQQIEPKLDSAGEDVE
jgi:PTS system nitrogen regulatory IIA component